MRIRKTLKAVADVIKELAVMLTIPLVLFLLAFVISCAPPRVPEPVVVREYVVVPAPEPQIPPRPILHTPKLPPDATLQELIKALLADREALAAWGIDLETRLKAYLKGEDDGRTSPGK